MSFMKQNLIAFSIFVSSLLPHTLYPADVSPSQVMTDQEIQAIGLKTPEQKKAFSQWLEKWAIKAIQEAPTYHPSQTISAWIDTWPDFMKPNANIRDPKVQQALKLAHQKIFRNMNGEKIELLDGSIWSIISFDQPTAQLWQRNDDVNVKNNEKDLMRPYIMYNTTREEQVACRMEQASRVSKNTPSDPNSYFVGSQPVTAIDIQNWTVSLKNKTKWRIAPTDQIKVQELWKLQDRIRVEKNNDVMYPFRLHNLDSGDTVLANKAY